MSAVDATVGGTELAAASTTSVTDAATSPFTMGTGDPSAMVCEGDVCFIPSVE